MSPTVLTPTDNRLPFVPMAWGISTALLACWLSYVLPTGMALLLLPLFVIAPISHRWTALAMMLCWIPSSLGGLLQPSIGIKIPQEPMATVQGLRWALTVSCLCIALFRSKVTAGEKADGLAVPAFLYALLLAAIALLTSEVPQISFMRVAAWALGLFAVYKCLEPLDREDTQWLLSFYLPLLGTLLLVGLLGRGMPGARIGFELFLRGIFAHSQTLGAVSAAVGAYLLCQAFLRGRLTILSREAILIVPVLATLYLSHSRTAAMSLVAGLLVGLFIHPGSRDLQIDRSAISLYSVLGILLLAAVSVADAGFFDAFLNKHNVSGTASQQLFSTRFGLAIRQLSTFMESPIFGSGFGLPALPTEVLRQTALAADSLATEKGLLPTAVLQETGLIGFFLWLVFITVLVRRVFIGSDPRLVAVAFASLFSNFGESTFFSFGGTGYFHWIWILLAVQSRYWREDGIAAAPLSETPITIKTPA